MNDLENLPTPARTTGLPPLPLPWGSPWKRIGLNSGWLLLGRVLLQVELALFTLLVARSLGAAGFGQYALITSTVAIFNVVTTFGTDTLLIRDLRHEAHRENLAAAALLLQLTLSGGVVVVVWFLPGGWWGSGQAALPGMRLYSLALLPLAFFSVFTAALRAWERMDLYLAGNLLAGGLQIGLGWAALRSDPHLMGLIGPLVAVQAGAAAIAGVLCWKSIPRFSLKGKLAFGPVFRILQKTWPLGLLAAIGIFYQRLGVLSLSAISGSTATGWFSAASRVVETLKIGHIAVLGAILPAMSRVGGTTQSLDETRAMMRKVFGVLFFLSLLEAASALILSPRIVEMLFGYAYAPAAPLLRVLAWQLLPYSLTSTLSLQFILAKREKTLAAATFWGALASAGMTLWLVTIDGAGGASLAAVIGECVLAIILFIFWRY